MQALLTIMIVDVEPLIAAAFVRSRSQMCERWDLLAAVRTPTTTPAYSMEGWICRKILPLGYREARSSCAIIKPHV